jgi:hypothetical protein
VKRTGTTGTAGNFDVAMMPTAHLIMTVYVVFLAFFVMAYYVHSKGVEAAFLNVWMPIFLCIPFVFTAHIPMVPIRTFVQAAIVPLLYVLYIQVGHRVRLGRLEVLIILYVILRVTMDYTSRGYKDAQNYAFYMLSCLVGPYLLGRYIISDRRMDIETIRRFVLIFLIFFPMFLYETKFYVSPIYKIMSPLFPDAFSGLSIRWGIARTAGTFEHPILACIMIIAVYRLHRWLTWTGGWQHQQNGLLGRIQVWLKPLPFKFETQIAIILVTMALMTISRGPWIGGIAAAILVGAGNMKNRRIALTFVAGAFLIGGVLGKIGLDAYTSPTEGQVLAAEAQTMLYRKVMVERYTEFLVDRLWTGWGLTDVPKIQGMESIDNAFFLMALQHGVLAPALFGLIFIYAIATQLQFGLRSPVGTAPLGFTFSGIYLMCFIAFTTVYMGSQTEPLLFLLLGWGESIKSRKADTPANVQGPAPTAVAPRFRRILR